MRNVLKIWRPGNGFSNNPFNWRSEKATLTRLRRFTIKMQTAAAKPEATVATPRSPQPKQTQTDTCCGRDEVKGCDVRAVTGGGCGRGRKWSLVASCCNCSEHPESGDNPMRSSRPRANSRQEIREGRNIQFKRFQIDSEGWESLQSHFAMRISDNIAQDIYQRFKRFTCEEARSEEVKNWTINRSLI